MTPREKRKETIKKLDRVLGNPFLTRNDQKAIIGASVALKRIDRAMEALKSR